MLKSLSAALRREPVRLYVYGVALTIVALLVAYGVIAAALAPLWLALATAVLAVPAVESARSRVTPVGQHRRS